MAAVIECHRCGVGGRPAARFCGGCGAVLGSARPGVRKTVTLLFADVRLPPGAGDVESGVRAAAAFYDGLRQVLVAHGGTVERSAGDAVMAVFGVPSARDDDARRAAAAALAVRQVVADFPGSAHISVGINTGEVLTGDVAQQQELAVGDAVVVAARLQQLAGPGEVLLGPKTVRLLGTEAVLGVPRQVHLKGRAGQLCVVPLEGWDGTSQDGERGPFVGRDPERLMLQAALDRTVATNLVQLVTVLAEAGLGASRLLREVLRGRPDVTVVRGTCRGYGSRSAWSALSEVLHGLAGVPVGDSAVDVLAALTASRPRLAGVAPVLASLLGDGDTPVGSDGFASAVARVLSLVAEDGPLVVLLEDLHLADGPLLDLVPDVVRRLEGCPVVVTVTARPELLEHRPTWGQGLRHVLGLTLRPMDAEASRQLAEALLPGDPDGVGAVLAGAGGNPLFLEQLAQAHSEGAGTSAPSVSAVLAARLDRLPVESRHVLERAAVIGAWGRVGDLIALGDGQPTVDVEAELGALARRDLLELDGGRWSFGSDLVREATEGGLAREVRADLHRRRGQALARQGANAAAGFHLELASHLLRVADPERSADLARQAAARLSAAGLRALSGDLVAAGDLLTRATALMAPDEPRRLALLPELARARHDAGDLVAASVVLDDAVSRTHSLGLVELGAHARLARLDLLRSTDPERVSAELPALLADVLPVLTSVQDDRGLALAWQLTAVALRYRVQWAAMQEPLERSLHHAGRSGDRRLVELGQGLQLGSMFFGPMHLGETRSRLEELASGAAQSPAHRATVEARLAATLALQGDPDAARARMARVRKVFRDLGRERSVMATACVGGPIELLAGRPDRAMTEVRAALASVQAMGDRALGASLAGLLAEACWRCRDLAGAAAAVEQSRSMAGVGDVISQVRWRSVQAKLLAAGGQPEQALMLSAEAVRMVSGTDELTSQGDVLSDAAEVHELLGLPVAAHALLLDAAVRYERKGAPQALRSLADRHADFQVAPGGPGSAPNAPARPTGVGVTVPATG